MGRAREYLRGHPVGHRDAVRPVSKTTGGPAAYSDDYPAREGLHGGKVAVVLDRGSRLGKRLRVAARGHNRTVRVRWEGTMTARPSLRYSLQFLTDFHVGSGLGSALV